MREEGGQNPSDKLWIRYLNIESQKGKNYLGIYIWCFNSIVKKGTEFSKQKSPAYKAVSEAV